MAQYAKDTVVSVEKSRAEIEATVTRYGATEFGSAWQAGRAALMFTVKDRRVRFILPLPDIGDRQFQTVMRRGYRHARTPEQARLAWEQACRQRWRALALSIKAKLETIASGIASFDEEMMPYVVLPDGKTIAETVLPGLPGVFEGKALPSLLPGPVQ